MSWESLLAEARSGSKLKASPDHGERHWRAVAATTPEEGWAAWPPAGEQLDALDLAAPER